ncbi:MAG: lipoprotein insertase outer membrane protein LolB [Burkholderiales bacterium]|jgi:outer membrane lipoprotein LolB|nr:lipoprotein insertase outer membrane protein LolB [Burkholderiales bacterium]
MRALAAAAFVVLAGCATLPPPAAPLAGDAFEVTGRFAARHGAEGGSGRIQWRHSAAEDDLVVSNPLGQGIARITRREGVYTLETADDRRFTSTDADALAAQALGWPLPVSGLPDWLRGRPVAGRPAVVERGANGEPIRLEQDGWRVEYLAFDDAGMLPTRLKVSRGDLDLRFSIESWNVAR